MFQNAYSCARTSRSLIRGESWKPTSWDAVALAAAFKVEHFLLHAFASPRDALHDACDPKIFTDACLILLKMRFLFVAPCLAFHICSEAFEPTTLYVDSGLDTSLVTSSVPSKRKLEQNAEEKQIQPHP